MVFIIYIEIPVFVAYSFDTYNMTHLYILECIERINAEAKLHTEKSPTDLGAMMASKCV